MEKRILKGQDKRKRDKEKVAEEISCVFKEKIYMMTPVKVFT